MQIHIVPIILIILFSGLAWYANNALNKVPVLVNVINVLIVVIAILLLCQSFGWIGDSGTNVSIR